MLAKHLAVVGLGLIGGSVARALRAAGMVGHISGYDPDSQRREEALSLGVIDSAAETPAAAVKNADLVIVAVPVLHTVEALTAIRGAMAAGTVVTDVGSTKQSVVADVESVFGELPPWFVPGHPIAGTEKSGVANSLVDLFRKHRVILTPHARQDAKALALVRALWEACGARVVEMAPAQHDAIFAATSHLPHILAYSFVDVIGKLDDSASIFPNAGGGFRDFTRIASSSPQMWHDIVRANAPAVGELLTRQIADLQSLQAMIAGGRWDELKAAFERARAAREHYLTQIE
ncbi:MAG: Prephenate dehydrogenase [Hydrocarboniphaga sp.]|uniref:prephenate dehydrogenase n=1 Tax=Hydrocarboniphaga sp. TaxID=2033016 RepID=UPI002619478B|nr:prephenate dehydrogenase/arogenate dehydrogenase family protein [Hydrocarboniphaga sp.]MDB5968083.1 Prephenate dehydrogenase [Hydrocarboniphaga sp.]